MDSIAVLDYVCTIDLDIVFIGINSLIGLRDINGVCLNTSRVRADAFSVG